jgi:hypothetical protein
MFSQKAISLKHTSLIQVNCAMFAGIIQTVAKASASALAGIYYFQ